MAIIASLDPEPVSCAAPARRMVGQPSRLGKLASASEKGALEKGMREIRIGLIGAGWMGKAHAVAYRNAAAGIHLKRFRTRVSRHDFPLERGVSSRCRCLTRRVKRNISLPLADAKEDLMAPENKELPHDEYIKTLFRELGNDAEDVFVAFRLTTFFVRKNDGSWTTIPRRYVDDREDERVKACLRDFQRSPVPSWV